MNVLLRTIVAILASLTIPDAWASGDPVRGKDLSEQCFACHGIRGDSPSPVNPRIGGQHEEYLLLALKAYRDGDRPNSLMTGAVLDKSDQDLADMAAYFAAQGPPDRSRQDRGMQGRGGGPGAGRDPEPGGPGMAMQFNHGERDSEFTSQLARARTYVDERVRAEADSLCRDFDTAAPATRDRDGDGLTDRFDAAPDDPNEFVADLNQDGYYEICNIAQLDAIATLGTGEGTQTSLSFDQRRARSYQLVTDLDAGGFAFEPIGNCGPTGNCMKAMGRFGYTGVFDGRGHKIRGLGIDAPERGGVGLFGVLAPTGVIMDLRLVDARVNGRAGVGAVVGSNFGTLYRCEASGQTSGMMAIGGLVGGSGGLVYGSHYQGRVEASQAAGGLVGDMTGAVFSSSAATEISGTRGIGGLIGLNTFGNVQDSHAIGNVSGTNDVGGLVGVNTDAKVRNSYATGHVTGESTNVGGLIGFNSQSIIRNSFATGNVAGADAVGGLVGRNKGLIVNGFAAGLVAGEGETGPIVGTAVAGNVTGVFDEASTDLGALTGAGTGWSPAQLPVVKPAQYFCDRNGNGFIDPDERSVSNYIWYFAGRGDYPSISCAADRM